MGKFGRPLESDGAACSRQSEGFDVDVEFINGDVGSCPKHVEQEASLQIRPVTAPMICEGLLLMPSRAWGVISMQSHPMLIQHLFLHSQLSSDFMEICCVQVPGSWTLAQSFLEPGDEEVQT